MESATLGEVGCLRDVPGILVRYLQSVYGDNLRAVFLYGSSLLRDADRPTSELTREDFEDKRCDFIVIVDDEEAAFRTLRSHWPDWTDEVRDEMVGLSRELGGRIVYFVPETRSTVRVSFRESEESDAVTTHEAYQIPYKFGILGLDVLLRDLSSARPHFYIAGRASKWSSDNLCYVSDDALREKIESGLAGLRRDVATIAKHLSRSDATEDDLIHKYFLFSYLCEAWRLDFRSKPRSLMKGLGDDVLDLVKGALREVEIGEAPDRKERARIYRTIRAGNLLSMKMSLGNSRSNKHSYSPNRMSGNLAYVWRKIAKIAPDILLMPFLLPYLFFRVLFWRWGWI